MYDEHYLNTDFNYEDVEKQYQDKQRLESPNPEALKSQLDSAHKHWKIYLNFLM